MKYVTYLQCKFSLWSPGVYHRQQAQPDEHCVSAKAFILYALRLIQLSASFIKVTTFIKIRMQLMYTDLSGGA